MTKKEALWRYILMEKSQKQNVRFTQKEIATLFHISLSTVHHALKTPRQSYAIRVSGRFFILENYKKLLILLASERRFQNQIIHECYVNAKPADIEALMPPNIRFGFYSGFNYMYGSTPADYDHVYVYSEKKYLPQILERISEHSHPNLKKINSNFFVLEPDPWFLSYPHMFLEQLYIDLWNAPEWYAKDFLKALDEKIGE